MSPRGIRRGNCPKKCGGTLIRDLKEVPRDTSGIVTWGKKKIVVYRCNVCKYEEEAPSEKP
jgi:hypothetical protein